MSYPGTGASSSSAPSPAGPLTSTIAGAGVGGPPSTSTAPPRAAGGWGAKGPSLPGARPLGPPAQAQRPHC
eukprot:4414630-Alexandrium_andersonii.AAC.1